VVVLLLVNGLATEGERGPLHAFCLGAHLPSLSCLWGHRGWVNRFPVDLEQHELGGQVRLWGYLAVCVELAPWSRAWYPCHGCCTSLQLSLLIIKYEQ
jgi:hypothetical protein